MIALASRGPASRHAALAAARSPFESTAVLVAMVLVALVLYYDPRDVPEVFSSLWLPDTDDAMRLVDVRALVAGQAWYDNHQYRFLPPDGALMHWSRLVDAPLAGILLVLTPLLGTRVAEGVLVVAWPVATFVVYAGLAFFAVRRAFSTRAAWLTLFVACQTGGLVGLFAFGRIDHHNVQICTILGVVVCLALPGVTRGRAALAGVLAALSLAIGLETLPYIAAIGVLLVLLWVRDGREAAPPLQSFGLALALGAPVLFAIQTAPSLWSVAACDALSPPWLWLSGGGGLAALLPRLAPTTVRGRLLAACALGAVIAAGFALLFPGCVAGPFAHLPPVVIAGWVNEVNEAKPFWAHLRSNVPAALSNVMPTAVATVVAAWFAWRLRHEARGRVFLFAGTMLATGIVIVQVQMRGIYISCAYVPIVAAFVLDRGLLALRDPAATGRTRFALLALSFLLIGKVWAAATVLPKALYEQVTLGSVSEDPTATVWRTCTSPANLASLNALPPGLVLGPIDFGPAILLHTHHSVVAAPYHRAADGLLAGLESFDGTEADMRGHATRLKADYVLVCPAMQGEPPGRPVPFATRLARGEASAAWLEPLALSKAGTLKAWHVQAWHLRP